MDGRDENGGRIGLRGRGASDKRSAVRLTEAAQGRVREMIAKRGKPTPGIRIGVRTKGCSGFSYFLEYVDETLEGDEVTGFDGFFVAIDAKSLFFVLGTEMDWTEDAMKSGFVFRNPNESGRCGCGESFKV